MNLEWVPTDGWPRFVVDAAWQSTLVAMIALCAIHTVARRPSTRALVSVIGMVMAVLLPVASMAARFAGWGILSSAAVAAEISDEPVAIQRPDSAAELVHADSIATAPSTVTTSAAALNFSKSPRLGSASPEPPRSHDDTSRRPSAAMIFLTIWVGLSVVMLIRLLRGVWRTTRLLKQAMPCSDSNLVSAMRDAAQRIGIETPHICFSSGVSSPTVFAFGRGVVLLPTRITPTPDRNSWLAVFCHELGHIRRRDGWNRVAIEAALVLLPWQPLAWLLRREFLHYSEEACDDWAVATGADPVALASILTDFVPTVPRPHLGAAIMNTDAKTRILRLLALRDIPRPRMPRVQLAAILAAAMIVGASIALAQRSGGDQQPMEPEPKSLRAAANDKQGGIESEAIARPTYVLEPPDIVAIEVVKLLPKGAIKIEKLDRLEIKATGTLFDHPVRTNYTVDEDGEVNLGPEYGRVFVTGMTVKEAIRAIEKHLGQVLAEPKVSLSVVEKAVKQHIAGTHAIGPDGYVNLGALGQVYVAGMTIDEARQAIEKHLGKSFDEASVAVKVHAQNSKVYYVVVENGDKGDHILRFPVTGNETVLDALAQSELRIVADMKMWISRKNPLRKDEFDKLQVNWDEIIRGGRAKTNYQLAPGDRLFIQGAEQNDSPSQPVKGKRS